MAQPGPSTPSTKSPAPTKHKRDNADKSVKDSNKNGAGSDSEAEDEMPDYLRIASLTSKSSSTSTFIPKRGEKDFEPTGFGGQSKLLQRSREAMFSAISGERRISERNLTRTTWDPSVNRVVAHQTFGKIFDSMGVSVKRDVVVDPHSDPPAIAKVTRLELLPEEALFLLERGAISCGITVDDPKPHPSDQMPECTPMSLQQAFSVMLDKDGCSRERYQVYAYLKRLGYVVQRADIVEAARAQPGPIKKERTTSVETQGLISDPKRPLRLVTIFDLLLYIPRRLSQIAQDALSWLWSLVKNMVANVRRTCKSVANKLSKTTGPTSGVGISRPGLLGSQARWDNYNNIFESLQIIPSGHDFNLPQPTTRVGSHPSRTNSESSGSTTFVEKSTEPAKGIPSDSEYEPFYYAYRPATPYKKSHPPPPEFRICIVNARDRHLPNVWEFEHMFQAVPIPGSEEELFGSSLAEGVELSAEEKAERLQQERELKKLTEERNKSAYGMFSQNKLKADAEKRKKREEEINLRRQRMEGEAKAAEAGQSWWMRLRSRLTERLSIILFFYLRFSSLFAHCPPGVLFSRGSTPSGRGGNRFHHNHTRGGPDTRPPNPFPPLKAGRRTVVLAVVDNGITSMIRFGETEFAKWKLAGRDGPGRGV
ncbi:hypothetical protein IE53DRAFT_411384 [Violaceomyces palustris]|uniref:Uncharacterized protein n=1 Tax=Violaceomyces palustris TaxID=1673888 RepID=A0ACD0NVE1_9BASI|nr:hypothetical protein IE53DRAFT_411384 [Violaceomyces palustris]